MTKHSHNKNRILCKKVRNQKVLAEVDTLERSKTFSQMLRDEVKESYPKIHAETNPWKYRAETKQHILAGRQKHDEEATVLEG